MTDGMDEDTSRILDRWLYEDRPPRYTWEDDIGWMDPIITKLAERIPEAVAKPLYARRLVRERESRKNRTSNAMLRDIYTTRQWPLDWWERSKDPSTVGKERVQLAMMRAEDFEVSASLEEADADAEKKVRDLTVEARRFFGGLIVAQNVDVFIDVNLPPAY